MAADGGPAGVVSSGGAILLEAGERSPARPLVHSFNTNLLRATALHGMTYDSPELVQAVDDMGAQGLRFPGGTIGNNYLWQEDSFATQDDDLTKWAAQALAMFRKSGKKYGLQAWAKTCKQLGVEPIYVLNVYAETPESTVELLRVLQKEKLDLKYIELANEPYWDPRSHNDVDAYLGFCRPLVEAIRSEFPEIQIGVCMGPYGKGGKYEETWGPQLAKETFYDAIVYHHYFGGQGIAVEAGVEKGLDAVVHPEADLAHHLDQIEVMFPGKPVWFTEWNLGSKVQKQWDRTGAESLFTAITFIELAKRSDLVDMACFHQIYQGGFGTFLIDKKSKKVTRFPIYQTFQLLGDFWKGAVEVAAVTPATADGSKDLVMLSVRKDGGCELLIVNRSGEDRVVDVSKFTGAQPDVKVSSLVYEDLAKASPNDTALATDTTGVAHSVKLDGFSINHISF